MDDAGRSDAFSVPMHETLAAAMELSAAAGITRIADISGLDDGGLHVVSVIRPNSRSLSVASGKGETAVAARLSGVMEALELYHAETVEASIPLDALHPTCLVPDPALFPRTVWAEGETFGRAVRMAIGSELNSGREAAVPLPLVHADFRTSRAAENSGFLISSNGLGGGASMSHAVAHAICEVIEGDAVALFRARSGYRYQRLPFREGSLAEFRDRSIARGIRPIAWDITTDIAVPVAYCRLIEEGPGALAIATDGAGCHPDREIALRRAFHEALQTRLLLISGARDDIKDRFYAAIADPCRDEPLGEPASVPKGADAGKRQAILPLLLEALRGAGFEQVIAIDLKSRSKRLAFVRVVIPGLEAFPGCRGYRPGRRALAAQSLT